MGTLINTSNKEVNTHTLRTQDYVCNICFADIVYHAFRCSQHYVSVYKYYYTLLEIKTQKTLYSKVRQTNIRV